MSKVKISTKAVPSKPWSLVTPANGFLSFGSLFIKILTESRTPTWVSGKSNSIQQFAFGSVYSEGQTSSVTFVTYV